VTTRGVAVLGSSANLTNVTLVAEWRALGLPCALVDPLEALLSPYEVAVGRLDVRGTLDGIEPGLLQLFRFERTGRQVLNRAAALLSAHDKLRTAIALDQAGLPHPATTYLRPHERGPLPEPPVVLKPRFGSWGRDVRLCRTQAEIDEALLEVSSRPWFRRHGILVQAALPTPGFDLRLLVAGGKMVGAVERHPDPGEWRTNVSVGATKSPASAPPEARALAIAAAGAVGTDLAGVDLMPLPGRRYAVIELNGAADFDPTYSPDRNVYADVADALGLLPAAADDQDAKAEALA
jgi:[lysine-biosynthesis-protein LysW]--L-2-aminoadipate ligase